MTTSICKIIKILTHNILCITHPTPFSNIEPLTFNSCIMHSFSYSFIHVFESSSPVEKLVLCIRSVHFWKLWTVITNLPNLIPTSTNRISSSKNVCKSVEAIGLYLKFQSITKLISWKLISHKKRRHSILMKCDQISHFLFGNKNIDCAK